MSKNKIRGGFTHSALLVLLVLNAILISKALPIVVNEIANTSILKDEAIKTELTISSVQEKQDYCQVCFIENNLWLTIPKRVRDMNDMSPGDKVKVIYRESKGIVGTKEVLYVSE